MSIRIIIVSIVILLLYFLFAIYIFTKFLKEDGVIADVDRHNNRRCTSTTSTCPDHSNSLRIAVYPLFYEKKSSVTPTGYVAVSNNVMMANFDGRIYIKTAIRDCENRGMAGFVKLPVPVVPRLRGVNDEHSYRPMNNNYISTSKPENQCLPSVLEDMMHAAVRDKYNNYYSPAIVPLNLDTGSFYVDMVNSLIISGYFIILR